jgi:hypothetical protein
MLTGVVGILGDHGVIAVYPVEVESGPVYIVVLVRFKIRIVILKHVLFLMRWISRDISGTLQESPVLTIPILLWK